MGKTLFKTKEFKVERYKVNERGKRFELVRIIPENSVVIIPVLDDGRIIIERQHRATLDRYLHELPAGHIHKGEPPSSGAIRELEEETGYKAGKLTKIFEGYPVPGSSTEKQTFFVAKNLVKTKQNLDPEEIIDLKIVTLKKAIEMVRTNAIMDDKSIAGILFYAMFVGK